MAQTAMNALADFHFIRPLWLLGLPPLALLLWRLYNRRVRQGDWAELCDPWLLPHVIIDRPSAGRRHGLALLGLGGMLALFALAGPAWQREPAPAFRNEQALVIVLDLSQSMDATDIKPSRLERARFKITDLLQIRKDGQTALVAYAGDAFTVAPLTDDRETIRAQLGALGTSIMPVQGDRADLALQQAEKLLRQAGLNNGHVLLIGDGVEGESARQAAEKLHSQGFSVSVLAVATAQGAPVVLPGGGFYKDASGAIVVPKLDSAALQTVASAGGGRYLTASSDNSDVRALAGHFERRLAQGEESPGQIELEQWRDLGPWLLLPLLPLAAMAFRRGVLAVAWLALLMPWPEDAAAWELQDLWRTPDQQAQQAMRQSRYEDAAARFENPAWKGTAYYRAGQYDKAAEALAGLDDAESLYNRGNALAQAGKYPEAVAAYEQTLQKDPRHADARHNKEEVEKQMRRNKDDKQRQSKHQDEQNQQQPGENGQDRQQPSDSKQDKETPPSEKGQKPPRENQHEPNKGDKNTPHDEPGAENDENDSRDGEPDGRHDEKNQEQSAQETATDDKPSADEERQANEAWLKRIPDDPGGLLRRKFQYQYQQRHHTPAKGKYAW